MDSVRFAILDQFASKVVFVSTTALGVDSIKESKNSLSRFAILVFINLKNEFRPMLKFFRIMLVIFVFLNKVLCERDCLDLFPSPMMVEKPYRIFDDSNLYAGIMK